MFSVYRYTRVKGDKTNQYPSLAWEFKVEGNNLFFRVARCQPPDNFSFKKAKEELRRKDWYKTTYFRSCSLVQNALEHLLLEKGRFPQMVVKTAKYILLRNALNKETQYFLSCFTDSNENIKPS